jgi:hypothetical protein
MKLMAGWFTTVNMKRLKHDMKNNIVEIYNDGGKNAKFE